MMIVVKDDRFKWTKDAIIETIQTGTFCCPRCKEAIRYPLIVSEDDKKAFDDMMDTIFSWSEEKGLTEWMMIDILKKCREEMKKRIRRVK